ncbi:MAG: ATP-dependent zinc metalloprotease FtsH [Planctomycetes bacterium]|nr:ATP-dependent zinc metalloprotease FtsH [Planctomycetota bacterium]
MESPSAENKDQKPSGSPQRPAGKPSAGEDSPRRSPFGIGLLVLIVIFAFAIWFWMKRPSNTGSRIKYSFFKQQLSAGKEGNIKEVTFHGQILTGKWKKTPDNPDADDDSDLKDEFNCELPFRDEGMQNLIALLEKQKVEFDAKESGGMGSQVLLWLFIPILLLVFFFFMMRRSSDPMGSGMMGNFIRSQAKRFHATEDGTTFDDVAGMDQAKAELQEIVEFLKSPEKYQKLGARIPKGVLLMGPPGTGKTLLARATAGEADVPFYSINGSEFIQMFVGVGASRVRDLFKTAKENAPCILFIDEIDAVGRVRGAGLGGGHDEREQTLNQILGEMDGFLPNESVIVLAATNRPDVLDSALLRPGRFDRHVTIDRPSKKGRVGILKVHTRNVPLGEDVKLEIIAAGTIGFSGADLRNLVNESALNATREGKTRVEMDDFERAQDKVLMGAKREDVLNEQEREMTAYHEAGHALLAWLFPDVDQVHKVTIIPRGRALGVTQLLPDEERYNIGEKRLHSQMAFMLGGRAAEKIVFNEYSAGAEDDLKRATEIARKMVAHWGMSEVIGPVAFRQGEEHPFLGKEIHEQRQFSEETARIIDQEVQSFLTRAADRARESLSAHRDQLNELTQALLERESLGTDDLKELLGPRQPAERESRNATPPTVVEKAT